MVLVFEQEVLVIKWDSMMIMSGSQRARVL